MRLFLLSLTLLLAGAVLSVATLFTTDSPITAFGPICTSVGLLIAVVNIRRKDNRP